MYRGSAKRYVWCFMGFEAVQECPTPLDKVLVLEEMIFPQCEKLGQTIIFDQISCARERLPAPCMPLCVPVPPSGCQCCP